MNVSTCGEAKPLSRWCALHASFSCCPLEIDTDGHPSSQKNKNDNDALEREEAPDSFLTDIVSRGFQNNLRPVEAAKVFVANSTESECLSHSLSCSSSTQQAAQITSASSPELVFSFNTDLGTPANNVATRRGGVILQTPQSLDTADNGGVALMKNNDENTENNASYCLASSSPCALALEYFSFDYTLNDKLNEEEKVPYNLSSPLAESMSAHFRNASWGEEEGYVSASASSQFSPECRGTALLQEHIPLVQEEERNTTAPAFTTECVEKSFYEVDNKTDKNNVKDIEEEDEEESRIDRASFSPFTESCSRGTTTTIGPVTIGDNDGSLPFSRGCSSVRMVPTTSTTISNSWCTTRSFSAAQSKNNDSRESPSFDYHTGEGNFNSSCVSKQTRPVSVKSLKIDEKEYCQCKTSHSVSSDSFPRWKYESKAEVQEMESKKGVGASTMISEWERSSNKVRVIWPASSSVETEIAVRVSEEEKELPSRSPSPTKPQAVPYGMMMSIESEPDAQEHASNALECGKRVLEERNPALAMCLRGNRFKDPYIGMPPVGSDATTASGRAGLSVGDPALQSPSPDSERDEPCCAAEVFSIAKEEELHFQGEKSEENRQAMENARGEALACESVPTISTAIHIRKKTFLPEEGINPQSSFPEPNDSRNVLSSDEARDMVKELTCSTSFTSSPSFYSTLDGNGLKGLHGALPKSDFTMLSDVSQNPVAPAIDASEKKPKEQQCREERKPSSLVDHPNTLESYVTNPTWLVTEPPPSRQSLSTFGATVASLPPSIRVTSRDKEQGREDTQAPYFCMTGKDSSKHQSGYRQEPSSTPHASQTLLLDENVRRSRFTFSTANPAVSNATPLLSASTPFMPFHNALLEKNEGTAGVTNRVVLENMKGKHRGVTEAGVEPVYPKPSSSAAPPAYPTARRNVDALDAVRTTTTATMNTSSLPSCCSSVEGGMGVSKRKKVSCGECGEDVRKGARPSMIRAEAGKTMALGGRRVLVEDLHLLSVNQTVNSTLREVVGRGKQENRHPNGERVDRGDGHQQGVKIRYGDEMARSQTENSCHGCIVPSLRRAPADSVKLVERRVTKAAFPSSAYHVDSYNGGRLCPSFFS